MLENILNDQINIFEQKIIKFSSINFFKKIVKKYIKF